MKNFPRVAGVATLAAFVCVPCIFAAAASEVAVAPARSKKVDPKDGKSLKQVRVENSSTPNRSQEKGPAVGL